MNEKSPTKRSSCPAQRLTFAILVVFVATSPATRSILVNFPDAPFIPFFVGAEMFTLVATSVVLAASREASDPSAKRRVLQTAVILNAGGGLVLAIDSFVPLPWIALFAAGTCCGAATLPLATLFIERLGRKTLGENALLVSGAMGAATLLFWSLSLLPSTLRSVLWILLLSCASAGLLFLTGGFTRGANPMASTLPRSKPNAHRSRSRDLSTVTSLLAVPLVGIFTFGVYIKAGVASDGARPQLFGIDEELALFLLAAAILAAVGAARPHRPLYASLYQVVVPAFACAILIVISFPNGSFVHSLGGMLVVFSMAFILLFGLAAATTLVGSGEIPTLFAASVVLSVYGAGRLAGLAFHSLIAPGPQAYEIYQIVVTVLLSIMLLITAFQGRRRSTGTSLDSAQTIAGKIDETCAHLAQAHGLSPRETEVLGLLARGYSPVYTAEKLVISESTARTHANRIYRKLSINTREELLALVDETEKQL